MSTWGIPGLQKPIYRVQYSPRSLVLSHSSSLSIKLTVLHTPTMSRPVELPTDDKILPVDHEEVASLHDKSKIPSDGVPLVSQDKYLSLWQTIKTYPRASTLSALAAFGAVSDGYQYNLPGNIIALPGFVQAFGTQNDAGKWAIDPQHVSLWSGECGYWACLRS